MHGSHTFLLRWSLIKFNLLVLTWDLSVAYEPFPVIMRSLDFLSFYSFLNKDKFKLSNLPFNYEGYLMTL